MNTLYRLSQPLFWYVFFRSFSRYLISSSSYCALIPGVSLDILLYKESTIGLFSFCNSWNFLIFSTFTSTISFCRVVSKSEFVQKIIMQQQIDTARNNSRTYANPIVFSRWFIVALFCGSCSFSLISNSSNF